MIVPLSIVAAVVFVLCAALRTAWPDFPLTNDQVLEIVVFLLGLFGVIVQLRAGLLRRLTGTDGWLKSKAFWLGVAALFSIVLKAYLPDFPLDQAAIGVIVIYIVGKFIQLELRARLW